MRNPGDIQRSWPQSSVTQNHQTPDNTEVYNQQRAADSEREKLISYLKDAFAEGRITQDELDARISAAHTAKTTQQLISLAADLPGYTAKPQPRDKVASFYRRWLVIAPDQAVPLMLLFTVCALAIFIPWMIPKSPYQLNLAASSLGTLGCASAIWGWVYYMKKAADRNI